jgi:class 3 adenylate cyclase
MQQAFLTTMFAQVREWIRSSFAVEEKLLPEQHRAAFVREVVFINLARIRVVSWFGTGMMAVIMFVVDALNILHLTHEALMIALPLHVALFAVLGAYLLIEWRTRPASAADVTTFHRVTIAVFSILLPPLTNALAYYIERYNGNAASQYLVVILAWSIGIIVPPRFGLRVLGLFWGGFLLAMWLAAQQGAVLRSEEYMTTTFGTVCIAIGIVLSYRNYVREFTQRKAVEEERNRIATLNAEIAAAYEEAETLNTSLTATLRELEAEREKAETLLLNILPMSIADRLKAGENLIADIHEEATILFADIVGFTKLSAQHSAVEIVQMLNWIFSLFDRLTEQYSLEKIKTIGDAYMVVGGIPQQRDDHVEAVARMALDMLREVQTFGEQTGTRLAVRVGIHTGSVVAGVIGEKKFVYDLWGDTVNTASRMESHGEAGKIHVTEEVYRALRKSHLSLDIGHLSIVESAPMTNEKSTNDQASKHQTLMTNDESTKPQARSDQVRFLFEERGEIEVKGKGLMRTWFLSDARL